MENFRVVKEVELEEIGCHLTQVVHDPSGATIIHLGNDDPENVFTLAFQTLPTSSDGVAHILEHTVLCGSKKYPVKDPFFNMIRRSLNTFMNAMTGDDITFYPAASQIPEDFYNLLDVYIDAVFFPNLQELSFAQEGHRLEYSDKGQLERKGIVYNEMKGWMASVDARVWTELMSHLAPNTPYQYNSGGDPKVIPELTWEGLKAFHRQYYHPSRCIFYFYGNIPLERHLKYLEKRVLGATEKLPPLPPLGHQTRFEEPVTVTSTYPLAPHEAPEEKEITCLGWLTTSPRDPVETLALSVVDFALMGTDAAPLKLALLRSGLCKEAHAFLDADMPDIPFVLFCKGCSEGATEKIEALTRKVLAEVAEKGISDEIIEAAIHQLEFHRSEITGDSKPHGLRLFGRAIPLLLLGVDPVDGLRIHSLFDELRRRLDKPGAVREIIETYLLNNPHFCRMTVKPDPEQGAREEADEIAHLNAIDSSFSEEDKAAIRARAQALHDFQEEQEGASIDLLPKVTLADVPKEAKDYPLKVGRAGPLTLHHHDVFTNGIVYASCLLDLPHIEEEELPYLQLLTWILPEIGCGSRSYNDNLEYIERYTGGIGIGVGLHPQLNDLTTFRPSLSLTGKALLRNVDKLFPLFTDMMLSADFTDRDRIKELLMQYASIVQNGLAESALQYANAMAASGFSGIGRLSNKLGGLDFYYALKAIAENLDSGLTDVIDRLVDLQRRILTSGEGNLVIGCEEDDLRGLQHEGFYGLQDLPLRQDEKVWTPDPRAETITSQGKIIASGVSFTSMVIDGLPYAHPDAPLLELAAKIMKHKVLHPLIREKGGAYGSGAANHPGKGHFAFFSYRDPHLANTIDVFHKGVETVAMGEFDQRDLEEAKLTTIQKLDSPISPGSRAGAAYSWARGGKTLDVRQAFRDQLLAGTKTDVMRAVSDHLLPKMDQGIIISFAGKDFFEKENRLLSEKGKKPLPVSPV